MDIRVVVERQIQLLEEAQKNHEGMLEREIACSEMILKCVAALDQISRREDFR